MSANHTFYARRNIRILLLCTISISQPLFDIFSKNWDYFMGWQIENIGILIFTSIIFIIPSGVLILCRIFLSKLSSEFGRGFEYAVESMLISAFLMQITKNLGLDSYEWISVLLIICALFISRTMMESKIIISNAKFISIAILIFPLTFFIGYYLAYNNEHREALNLSEFKVPRSSEIPIVIIIFDELPTVTLLNKQSEIDSGRYRNIFEFSQESVWYKNAVSTATNTKNAVPTILSGIVKPYGTLPTVDNYPINIFTTLQNSHGINAVYSEHTDLCPEELWNRSSIPLKKKFLGIILDVGLIYSQITLPSPITQQLRPISMKSHDYFNVIKMGIHDDQRVNRHNEFLRLINEYANNQPPLYFLHSILPHVPWYFKPDGKMYSTYADSWIMPGIDYIEDIWTDQEWTVIQAWRRHILQTMYVDMQLGEIITLLKKKQIYDKAMIIVTADHGASFWPSGGRRQVLQNPESDIFGVPLLIKYPNSNMRGTDARESSIADILPTILDVVGGLSGFKFDGKSLLTTDHSDNLKYSDSADLDFEKSLARKSEVFGDNDLMSIYMASDYGKLVGKKVSEIQKGDTSNYLIKVQYLSRLDEVDTSSSFIPSQIFGKIKSTSANDENGESWLAVSINGIIGGITKTRHASTGKEFDFLVPDAFLKQGRNQIRFYEIEDLAGISLNCINHSSYANLVDQSNVSAKIKGEIIDIYRKISRWFIL
jgi:hypothetical protein